MRVKSTRTVTEFKLILR